MTQIKLELVFFGDLLDPIEFSNLIDISATTSWHKGDVIPHNNKVCRQETTWEYSTGFIQTYYLEEVTNKLLDKFESYVDIISEYVKTKKIGTKIYVVTESIVEHEKPALYIDKRIINFMSKIGGEIDFDLYFFDENVSDERDSVSDVAITK